MHGCHGLILGQLEQASIKQMQLEMGLHYNFFLASYNEWGCLAMDSLVKCIWKFVSDNKIELHNNQLVLPNFQQYEDHFIMEVIGGHSCHLEAYMLRVN
jgi:hypothetical protein